MLNLAAHVEFAKHGGSNEGYMTQAYRFDTRCIWGDYTIIEVALPFASETAARNEFYNLIKRSF